MRGFAIDGEALQFLMRFHEQRSAGSFVGAARFHSDEAIFDEVGPPDAVLGGDIIQRVHEIDGAEFRAVDRNRRAGFKSDFDFFGFVRSFLRGNDPLPHCFVRRVRGILELATFVAEVPDVTIAAVDIFFALLDGNVVLLRVSNGIFAGIDVPLAPRSNNLHVGSNGFVRQFESDLVVAFAGAAVREAVGTELERNFRLALGDDRARHRSAEQIRVLVDGAGAQSRPNIITHKFFAQIFDVRGRSARGKRFLARGFEIFLLADVADHGDDFATVVFLEPGNDDGGVQAAGVGEDNFFRLNQFLFHDSSLAYKYCQAGAPAAAGAPTKETSRAALENIASLEQSMQDGFLHVHAVFGLIEDDRLRTVEDFRGDFQAAVRRKTVHEYGVRRGERHQLGVDLIRLEHGVSHLPLGLKSHAGPGIGVDAHRAVHRFARVGQQLDFGFRFARHAFAIGDNFRQRCVFRGRSYAQVNAEASGKINQRVANIVAITDVGKFEAAKRAEFFFEGEKIRERLARMKLVGERIDHRNARVGGHFFEDTLLVNASDDAMHPALEVARDIGDGLARAERRGRLCVVKEDDGATHALNADIEGDTRAERGLLKNQGDEFSLERGRVADRAGLDIRGELEQFARVRGAPLRSGEEIIRQGNGRYESGGCHFSFHLAVAWATRFESAAFAESGAEACCGVVARTSSKSLRNSRTCARVMMKGGSRRNVKSWVQLISKARCMAQLTRGPPSMESSTPIIKPSTRISRMKSNLAASFVRPSRNSSPRARIFSSSFSSSRVLRNSMATAQASGPPPNVVPCIPGETREATSLVVRIAPRGSPAARGLAIKTMSGLEVNF